MLVQVYINTNIQGLIHATVSTIATSKHEMDYREQFPSNLAIRLGLKLSHFDEVLWFSLYM